MNGAEGSAMGILSYDGEEFDFDDRVLLHLQFVISTKLRRRENFFITWPLPMERGSGRRAIWIDNGVPIHFFYGGSRPALINRDWIDQLLLSAAKSTGLVVGPEPKSRPPGLPDSAGS